MPTFFPLLTFAGSPTDGVSEVQSLTPSAPAPGPIVGTYTITFDGQETDAIDAGATFAEIQAAIEALSNVGEGNIVVSGDDPLTPTAFGDGGVVTLTYAGVLAGRDVPEVTVDDSGLEDSDSPANAITVTVATETAGVLGTYRGAPPGQPFADTQNGVIYENTGTAQVPVWTYFSNVGA